jgi:ribosomal protein L4
MENIDLTKLNIQELKAFIYDNLVVAERCQKNIQLANQEINNKSVPTLEQTLPTADVVEEDKKK